MKQKSLWQPGADACRAISVQEVLVMLECILTSKLCVCVCVCYAKERSFCYILYFKLLDFQGYICGTDENHLNIS